MSNQQHQVGKPAVIVTSADAATLRRMQRKLDNIRGPGVVNRPDGITINPPPGPKPRRQSPSPAGYFPVDVEQTGGSNGTVTTACSYTYNVFTKGTTTMIGSALPVERPRYSNGPLTAATVGSAYYNSSSSLILYEVGESIGNVTCSAVSE